MTGHREERRIYVDGKAYDIIFRKHNEEGIAVKKIGDIAIDDIADVHLMKPISVTSKIGRSAARELVATLKFEGLTA